MITPKFVGNMSPEACAKPTNMRTRALSTELSKKGVLPDNIVSIAASRPDEVSFDDARSGGLATVAWRDCMLGKAKDSDGNGMLNVEEITSCAQNSLDQKLKQFPDILGQHMTIGGNKAFIPSYQLAANGNANSALSSVSTSVVAPSLISNGQSIDNSNSATPSLPQPSISTIKPAELLGQIHAQRDAQRSLQVTPSLKSLRILQDPLQVTVQSPRSGYLYMALAGSDEKSLYLLFPNSLDGNNYIEANTPIELPRKGWRITAAGPKGLDTVLVIVADSPRDLSQLASEKAGPFVKTLLNPQGNGQLQWLLGNSANADQKICQEGGTKRNLQVQEACSDAFASVILHIEEKEGQ
jgi:hypothetical protein